jgi:hypothetical protein
VIEEARLWHVTVTMAGAPVEPLLLRAALQRLTQQRPFISGVRFSATSAEISYWDEADTLVDAASLGLRLWNEHRASAKLPAWEVVALDVADRDRHVGGADQSDLTELKLEVQGR